MGTSQASTGSSTTGMYHSDMYQSVVSAGGPPSPLSRHGSRNWDEEPMAYPRRVSPTSPPATPAPAAPKGVTQGQMRVQALTVVLLYDELPEPFPGLSDQARGAKGRKGSVHESRCVAP